jgi:hypothetical protein
VTDITYVTEPLRFDRDILEALHKVGFKTNLGIKGTGFGLLASSKAGGYYFGLSSFITSVF